MLSLLFCKNILMFVLKNAYSRLQGTLHCNKKSNFKSEIRTIKLQYNFQQFPENIFYENYKTALGVFAKCSLLFVKELLGITNDWFAFQK